MVTNWVTDPDASVTFCGKFVVREREFNNIMTDISKSNSFGINTQSRVRLMVQGVLLYLLNISAKRRPSSKSTLSSLEKQNNVETQHPAALRSIRIAETLHIALMSLISQQHIITVL